MDLDSALARCLALPGAVETYPFGDEVAVGVATIHHVDNVRTLGGLERLPGIDLLPAVSAQAGSSGG